MTAAESGTIAFLDLKQVNEPYAEELLHASKRVIDSGWYILGKEVLSVRNLLC